MSITRDDTLLTDETIEKYTDAGYWAEETLADVFRRNAFEAPDQVAYVDNRSEITWEALWQISGALASGLASRGVGRGDVVAVQLPNRIEFVCLLAAVVRLGAVFCQFPPDYRTREIEFILRFSEAHTIVVPDRYREFDYLEMIDEMRGRLPNLVNTIAVPTGEQPAPSQTGDWASFEQIRAAASLADPAPDRAGGANEVMRIAFTSGTTGEPKAVIHTTNTSLFFLRRGNEEWGVGADDTMLVILPVGLNAGFSMIVQTALARARAILMERFKPAAALDLIEKYRVSLFLGAPTAIIALLADEVLDKRDISSLRLAQTGGASTPVKVLREANQRLGCPVIDTYGMLETGLSACTSPTEPYEEWVGTVGRPYPWMKLRILDPNDVDVPDGTEGEIAKTGPAMMVGYYRNPKKNQESWTSDGWFRSGDRGYIDPAGRLVISGRSKDMIIHGGANIWPRELEEVLVKHPGVAEVAVIGIPDAYFGENVCACIVPRTNAELMLDDVISFVSREVAKYKWPQRLELFETFPLGPTGKVLKRELAQEVEQRRSAAVEPAQ